MLKSLSTNSALIISFWQSYFISSEYKCHSSMKCISSSTALLPPTTVAQHLQILLARGLLLWDSTFKLWVRRRSLAIHLILSLSFNKFVQEALKLLLSNIIQVAFVIDLIPSTCLSPRFLGFIVLRDCQSMSAILEMPLSMSPMSILLSVVWSSWRTSDNLS